MISAIFNHVFDREGVLSFERIANLKKAETRQYLKDLPTMTPYVEAYVCLLSMDITAMPLDDMGLAHLKHVGALESHATVEEGQKFIEGHLKPEEIYELFSGLRRIAKDNFVPPAPAADPKAKKKK
jgi:hypothetical protein